MHDKLSQPQKELLKHTLIASARTALEQSGFTAAQELWRAIFQAFYSDEYVPRHLPSGPSFCDDNIVELKKQWATTCLEILSKDISFLEQYQSLLEDKLSPPYLEVSDCLIKFRKAIKQMHTNHLADECIAIGKSHLQLGNYKQAITHFSTALEENRLAWHLSSSMVPCLSYGTLDEIEILLTAHEQSRLASKSSWLRYSSHVGFPVMQILLQTSFEGQLSGGPSYTRLADLIKVTAALARLYLLQEKPKDAVCALQRTCDGIQGTGNSEIFIAGTATYSSSGIEEPEIYPNLWYQLSTLKLAQGDQEGAHKALEQALAITKQYIEILEGKVKFHERERPKLERLLLLNAEITKQLKSTEEDSQ